MIFDKNGEEQAMEYIIEIKQSNRKTIAFEIKEAGVLIVRAPFYMTRSEILQEIHRHQAWIDSHMEKAANQVKERVETVKFSSKEIRQMADMAVSVIPPRVEQYAQRLGVSYGRITIRSQRTRWGSCSSKGNLNFNCLLTQVPEQVMDYVIVHELCHRIEMNHSDRFWKLVEQIMPDYKTYRKWLKDNGTMLIERLP